MRLTILDERQDFTRQTHAYAEYRAFSGLADRETPIEDVTVTLARREAAETATGDAVVCTIAVTLGTGEGAAVRAVAGHAYAAIDNAVSLIRHVPLPAGEESPARGKRRSPACDAPLG
jgi:hypothetical protein